MDKDLERILNLVNIIRKYEYLVEYLLEPRMSFVTDDFKAFMSHVEREVIITALIGAGGNISHTATNLKISRTTMIHKMGLLNINSGDYR